jgi:hypothetical protein
MFLKTPLRGHFHASSRRSTTSDPMVQDILSMRSCPGGMDQAGAFGETGVRRYFAELNASIMEQGTPVMVTVVSPADAEELRKGARWARFLGVVGMVFAGLMLLMGVFFGSLMRWIVQMQMAAMAPEAMDLPPSGMETMLGAMGIAYLLLFTLGAVLYFIPAWFLYQHGSRMRSALQGAFDGAAFHQGVVALRKLFSFMGILTLVLLCLYGLFFAVGVLAAVAASMAN